MKTDYTIVKGWDVIRLEIAVRQLLPHGYKPVGGVVMLEGRETAMFGQAETAMFGQAMFREEGEDV